MPTYEYRCKDCGHTFDAYQAFTDEPLTACPSCDGTVKKVFGSVGISFKGSGFYKTDSRSGGSSASGSSSSSGNGASEGSSSDAGSSKGEGSSKGDSSSKGEAASSSSSSSGTSKAASSGAS